MFKDLRPNSPFFILRKGEKPTLEIGAVQSVSQPMPKPMQNNFMAPELVVDVAVKIGGETHRFEKLPATMAIADFGQNGAAGIVVSCNKDAIRNEIEIMLAQSRSIIDSVEYHRGVMQECEDILKSLNPAFAKDKEREQELKSLQSEVSDMRGKMDEMLRLLSVKMVGEQTPKPEKAGDQTPKPEKSINK